MLFRKHCRSIFVNSFKSVCFVIVFFVKNLQNFMCVGACVVVSFYDSILLLSSRTLSYVIVRNQKTDSRNVSFYLDRAYQEAIRCFSRI